MPAIIRAFRDHYPRLGARVYLADGVVVIGDVELADDVNVWFGSVLRGDVGKIRVGARTNLQDGCIVHMTGNVSEAEIGADVTVGHRAVIHGARIGDGALIGMGALILDNAEVGPRALVAAGSVVPPRLSIPPETLARGAPARVIRELSPEEREEGRRGARVYLDLARTHAAHELVAEVRSAAQPPPTK